MKMSAFSKKPSLEKVCSEKTMDKMDSNKENDVGYFGIEWNIMNCNRSNSTTTDNHFNEKDQLYISGSTTYGLDIFKANSVGYSGLECNIMDSNKSNSTTTVINFNEKD